MGDLLRVLFSSEMFQMEHGIPYALFVSHDISAAYFSTAGLVVTCCNRVIHLSR